MRHAEELLCGPKIGTKTCSTVLSSSADGAVSEAAIRDQWPIFCEEVLARLAMGAREYGDASFAQPAEVLVTEIQQELFDVCGWGFILSCRVNALSEKLARLEARAAESQVKGDCR